MCKFKQTFEAQLIMFNAKSLIFIICISLLSLLKVNSQDFTIGVRGGLNYYTIGDINSRGGSLPNRPPDELNLVHF